ncbi:phytanoyl-CoA dioxygenase family protein [Kitasatospora sp. NPDC056138]|uniref:phytanoyl-CoA dioxygenase family protein n=1 Tax=Kitasatospora sp. NPDC056138 TaxID=3345724 RepID=UPI0035DB33E6
MSETVQGYAIARAAAAYHADGFCLSPVLVPDPALDAACAGIDEVLAGRYETGAEPYARDWVPSEHEGDVVTVAEPRRCNRAIRAAIVRPELSAWAIGLTGAHHVEIIAVDLFLKGPTTSGRAHVGWHQDAPFLQDEDEVLTAWLALSDVSSDSSPLLYVRGSHRGGTHTARDHFFAADLDTERLRALLPAGQEPDIVAVSLPRGALSFHHRHTVHASGANTTVLPRISLAIRLRVCRTAEVGPALPGHDLIPLYKPAATAG